jgi:hypothetical protein
MLTPRALNVLQGDHRPFNTTRMGDWYIVTKKINGKAYRYRQRTWRDGKSVRTESQYIGPLGADEFSGIPKSLASCNNEGNMMKPILSILPEPQRALWDELSTTPSGFTLYGGTAIALRLGHRYSVDFDFFSARQFDPTELRASIPYLAGSTLRQSTPNTLTVSVERGGPVQLSYFGGLERLGQVAAAEVVEGPKIAVASLLDLSATKVAVVYKRCEVKDYIDIHALLTTGGIPLPVMLSAAAVIYGAEFNPLISLKAISYHADLDLNDFPASMRRDLVTAVRKVDVTSLPAIDALRHWKERP